MTQNNIEKIRKKAKNIRKYILEMTTEAGSGHPGGSLSATDIIATLYFYKLNHDPKDPNLKSRDRFILSKGHCCPAQYAALALAGYFDESELMTLRKLGSRLQGHPERESLPGIEASTGPLGQGLSFANGVALAARIDNLDYSVYVLMGDGELQEGQIWEAAMTASNYEIDNLTAIVDYNRLQIDGEVSKVKKINPLKEKFEAFGWEVFEIKGHNIKEIIEALDKTDQIENKPSVIIAHTTKGKGVPCMENKAEWHGKACTPEQLKEVLKHFGDNNE